MNHTETIQTAYNELKSEEEMLRKNLADLLKKIKPLENYLKEVGVIQKKTRSRKQPELLKAFAE